MRSIRATLVLVATLLICTSGALITRDARAGDYNRSGGYFGVSGVYGINLFTDEIFEGIGGLPPGTISLGNSGGLNTRLGARFLKFVALELQYEWIHGIDARVAGIAAGTYKPHTLTGNLKLHLPISRFQPYLLAGVGVGFWKFESLFPAILPSTDTTGFAGRAGLGIDFYITEHIALNAEGVGVFNTANFNFSGTDALQTNLYYFSVSGGLIYRF